MFHAIISGLSNLFDIVKRLLQWFTRREHVRVGRERERLKNTEDIIGAVREKDRIDRRISDDPAYRSRVRDRFTRRDSDDGYVLPSVRPDHDDRARTTCVAESDDASDRQKQRDMVGEVRMSDPYMRWIVIHCSASPPSAGGDAYTIDRYHKSLGWRGCGYHFVITRDGVVQAAELGDPCRAIGETAAHARGQDDAGFYFNKSGIGVCLIGGVDDNLKPENNFTERQWSALRRTVTELISRYDIPTHRIAGHRDIIKRFATPDGPKACPSFDVRKWVVNTFGMDDPSDDEMGDAPGRDHNGYATTHVAREGDTFWGIGELYGIPQSQLKQLNSTYPVLSVGQGVILHGVV